MARRLVTWLFLAAIVLGVAGLAVTTERTSAQIPDGDRFGLSCEQTVDPTGAGTKGAVECTIAVTGLPDPLPDITLGIVVTYVDVDGSGDPSAGDQLQCITVTQAGNTLLDFCRDGAPEPPPTPTTTAPTPPSTPTSPAPTAPPTPTSPAP